MVNNWADLLSRWPAKHTIWRIVSPHCLQLWVEDFEWLSTCTIAADQSKHGKPQNVQFKDDLSILLTGQIWIPKEAADLYIRLFVPAHISSCGYRSQSATVSTLVRLFHWKTVELDTRLFVNSCIHYLPTTKGEKKTTTVCTSCARNNNERPTPIRLLDPGQIYYY